MGETAEVFVRSLVIALLWGKQLNEMVAAQIKRIESLGTELELAQAEARHGAECVLKLKGKEEECTDLIQAMEELELEHKYAVGQVSHRVLPSFGLGCPHYILIAACRTGKDGNGKRATEGAP